MPLAPPDTWLPHSALWPDNYVPTAEERREREEGIEIAYRKALNRRHAARQYAKKVGKPLPALNEPLVPLATDYPWKSRPRSETDAKARLLLGLNDIRTPERQERLEQAMAEFKAARRAGTDERRNLRRLYEVRKTACQNGQPIPPTPFELKKAEQAAEEQRRTERRLRFAPSRIPEGVGQP